MASSSINDKEFLCTWVASNRAKMRPAKYIANYWSSGLKPTHWKRIHKQTNPDGSTTRVFELNHGTTKIKDKNPATTEVYDLPNDIAVITSYPSTLTPTVEWITTAEAYKTYGMLKL